MTARRRPLPVLQLAAAAAAGAVIAGSYVVALVLALVAVAFALARFTAAARRRDRAIDELLRRDAARARLAEPASHVALTGFGIPATPRPRVVALPPRESTAASNPVAGFGR